MRTAHSTCSSCTAVSAAGEAGERGVCVCVCADRSSESYGGVLKIKPFSNCL